MTRRTAAPLAALCAAALWTAAAGAQPCATDVCVSITPSSHSESLGGTFTLDVVADFNTAIVGWGLDITFDTPGVIAMSASPVFGPGWFQGFAPDGDGLAALAFPNSMIGDDLLLLQLTFQATAIGDTNVMVSVTSGDTSEGFAKDPSGFASLTMSSAHISVTPEPGTLALLGAALMMMRGRRRRG